MERIDFWDNRYDLSLGIFVNNKNPSDTSLSLSKKDKKAKVTREEIVNALALGIIGLGNQENNRYEYFIKDILDRCIEIEEEQTH